MRNLNNPALIVTVILSAVLSTAQTTEASSDQSTTNISLTIAPGVPLRLYLTQRLPKRMGEPVHAKLLEPLFAFDREVIPAGVEVQGTVVRLDSESKMKRAAALLGGDFTPLHQAQVQFTTVVLKDGRQIALNTRETLGLNSMVSLTPPKKKKNPKPANPTGTWDVVGQQAKQKSTDAIHRQINARTRGVADLVRGPDKKERLQEFLLLKLPYHPQWVRKGTRFDAELQAPLQFGPATFEGSALKLVGSQPPADSIVHARLITPLNSAEAKQGERVEAILSQPLFSPDNHLILPEGTHLVGAVTQAHAARWFHRGGQLRFSFQNIGLPPSMTANGMSTPVVARTQARLQAAESGGATDIAVDDEGGVKAKESKTRFIAPAISVLIASKSLDNDAGRTGAAEGNAGGRTLGGLSGFGVLGGLAAQSSKIVGSVLGVYGMAWSVYANIVSRGGEVVFGNNAAVDIRFGSRTPK